MLALRICRRTLIAVFYDERYEGRAWERCP
jgi:hypothetical protein